MEQTPREVSPKELWVGVATGPIVWAIHFVVIYAIVSLHCKWGLAGGTLLGLPALLLIVLGLTLLAIVAVFYAGYLAYRNWKRLRWVGARSGQVEERYWFMARIGLYSAALYALALAVSAVPTLFIPPCW